MTNKNIKYCGQYWYFDNEKNCWRLIHDNSYKTHGAAIGSINFDKYSNDKSITNKQLDNLYNRQRKLERILNEN